MKEIPSLFTLCMEEVKKEIIHGDDIVPYVYGLPPDLFDSLLAYLPSLALQKLQDDDLPMKTCNYHDSTNDCIRSGGKRKRCGDFDTAWKALFKSRWPEIVRLFEPADLLENQCMTQWESRNAWQQIYWETHLQNCLDEAAEAALLPSFDGHIGEIKISDSIIKAIGYEGYFSHSTYEFSKLSFHCQQFGHYARCLRLQNVLCVAETCHLLRSSKLQSLVVRRIISKDHVDGLCKLLNQNRETLKSLEFINCKFSSAFMNAICDSLHMKDIPTHGVHHFSIKGSTFLKVITSLPTGLISFLSSGRSLRSLNLCDNCLGRHFAGIVFDTLIKSSSTISILDLSDNNISGWLSNFCWRSPLSSSSDLGLIGKSLQSLRVLNLRGNNLGQDDASSLRYVLGFMPNLESLDISDNPIEDEGIKSLIPYFIDASERETCFSDLKLENCELSCDRVIQLLEVLSNLKKPLKSLSIADNELGSKIAASLGKFLGIFIQVLNIEDIGLGSSGFLELQECIVDELKIVNINMSKNRGGIEAARFVSKLIVWAPELVAVNAGYNFLPVESLTLISSALKVAKGKLEHLDLTGNTGCYQPPHACSFANFQCNGRPIVLLPSLPQSNAPYDDDP